MVTSVKGNADRLVLPIFADGQDALGTPDAPTQAGFLALARAGDESWNQWRATWPGPRADFQNVDFRHATIDFSGFQFGGGASFAGAQFGDQTTFAGAQFGNQTNFTGAQFGDLTRFNGARFGDQTTFGTAQFGNDTSFHATKFSNDFGTAQLSFQGAQFGDRAAFPGAHFGDNVTFANAQFGDHADFSGTQFGWKAIVAGAQFGNEANFSAAQFGDLADFSGAQFGDRATFSGAQLGNFTSFCGARFAKRALFDGAQFSDATNFDGAEFGSEVSFLAWSEKRVADYWRSCCSAAASVEARVMRAKATGLRSDTFQSIYFSGVQFSGDVNFQNREFLGITAFGPMPTDYKVITLGRERTIAGGQPTRFHAVPEFHGCKLHQNTSFDDVQFLAPPSLYAARAYRTLKLAMAEQLALRDEQRFFRLEMMAEGASTKGARRNLFVLYKVLSDYGFSLTRPLYFWSVILVVFGLAHGILAGPSWLQTEIDWQRTMQWAQYVLFNAIPLPGFDKAQFELRGNLFGRGEGVMLAALAIDMLHKSCALLAAFLAALALRNLFKMKG